MRSRLPFVLALLLASITWLGATPSIIATPKVVVFPLTVNGDADKDSGNRLAVLLAQQMSENGVKVVPAPPGTERKDFLTTARTLGCDYYVSGFVTPLGEEVTVVEQVVSALSGTVIFSNSTQLLTYADANGQGEILANSVIRHASRGLASLGDAPTTANTPAPKETNEANLSGGLSGLFRRRPKSTPSPSASPGAGAAAVARVAPSAPAAAPAQAAVTRAPAPSPSSPPPRPAPTVAVVARASAPPTIVATPQATAAAVSVRPPATGRVALFAFNGTAENNARAYAATELAARLQRSGQDVATLAAIDPNDLPSRASELCAANGAKALVGASLGTRDGDRTFGPSTIAQLDVRVVNCSGRVVLSRHFEHDGTGRNNAERAIAAVIGDAAGPVADAIR